MSSRLLRKERPDIQKRYWKGALWSPSYFASSCGGAPISIVRQYIKQQQNTPLKLKDGYAVCAILPRPERRGLSRTRSPPPPTMLSLQILRSRLSLTKPLVRK